MLPMSRLLGGWSRIMRIKNLGIPWHLVIPHKSQRLLCLNSRSYCCCYIVTLHFHYLRNWQLKGITLPVNLLKNNWEIWKDPETLLALYSLRESFFTCPVKGWEWSIYVEHSNVEIPCGGKGAVCLSRDRHPSPEKVLKGTPKGGGLKPLVQLPLQKT